MAGPVEQRYVVVGGLGRSDIAATFAAREGTNTELDRWFVLKFPRRAVLPTARDAHVFLSECQRLARLGHDGLAPIVDVGVLSEAEVEASEELRTALGPGPAPYVATAYLPGETLTRVLEAMAARGRLMVPELAAYLMASVCDVLDHAYGPQGGSELRPSGVLHGNLCPDNVLVTYAGTVKTLDLGLEQALGVDRVRFAPAVRTLAYLAPERSRGEDPSHAADLYSVGVLLWEAVTGQALFRGRDVPHTLQLVRDGYVPALRELIPDLPADFVAIVGRALSHDRDARYGSAYELGRDLRRFLASRGAVLSASEMSRIMADLFGARALEVDPSARLGAERRALPRGASLSTRPPIGASSTSASEAGRSPLPRPAPRAPTPATAPAYASLVDDDALETTAVRARPPEPRPELRPEPRAGSLAQRTPQLAPTLVRAPPGSTPLPHLSPAPGATPVPVLGRAPVGSTPLPVLGRVPLGATPAPVIGRVPVGSTPLPNLGRAPGGATPLPNLGRAPGGATPLPNLGQDKWSQAIARHDHADPRGIGADAAEALGTPLPDLIAEGLGSVPPRAVSSMLDAGLQDPALALIAGPASASPPPASRALVLAEPRATLDQRPPIDGRPAEPRPPLEAQRLEPRPPLEAQPFEPRALPDGSRASGEAWRHGGGAGSQPVAFDLADLRRPRTSGEPEAPAEDPARTSEVPEVPARPWWVSLPALLGLLCMVAAAALIVMVGRRQAEPVVQALPESSPLPRPTERPRPTPASDAATSEDATVPAASASAPASDGGSPLGALAAPTVASSAAGSADAATPDRASPPSAASPSPAVSAPPLAPAPPIAPADTAGPAGASPSAPTPAASGGPDPAPAAEPEADDEDPSDAIEIGEALARDGRQALLAGDLAKAEKLLDDCVQFGGPATCLRDLGAVHERRGHLESARAAYRAYLDQAAGAPDRAAIEARIAALAPPDAG
jgi:hypothetical protein